MLSVQALRDVTVSKLCNLASQAGQQVEACFVSLAANEGDCMLARR